MEIGSHRLVVGLMALVVVSIFLSSFLRGPGLPSSRHSAKESKMNEEIMAAVPGLMSRIQKDPKDKEAVLELAGIFDRAEEWPRALQFWTKAIELDPENLGVRYHRGFALMKLERYAEAVPDYEHILQVKPESYLPHYYLGMINKHVLNNPEAAKRYLQQALASKPDDEDLVAQMKKELSEMP